MQVYREHLLVGYGEVGQALHGVLAGRARVIVLTKNDEGEESITPSDPVQRVEIMHICIPYSHNFFSSVKEYQKRFRPLSTVIHSTVPVGISRKLKAVHSPVRGIHPNLENGIRTFVKFLGGSKAGNVADFFRSCGLRVMLFDKAETTEAMKLFDTEYYRMCIEFVQRVKRYCDKNGLNFTDVYRIGNITYNEGYERLGYPEYRRPILEPIMGPIGGHCVESNKELIKLSENAI